ncbi:protein of unknown function [Kyrpidia spormannii]|uniref:Uncharacterized protein n=1 Tax=Kyrpidia spormannii TaxID=2055160 RepID=A0ACA8Z5R0_9BACL|nr:protein of unknown function [Kyrpidia spormannii]
MNSGEGPNIKTEVKPVRSREGRRQPKTLNRDYPREEVVKPRGTVGEPSPSPAQSGASPRGEQGDGLMEKVVARQNMLAALKRVEQNKGAPAWTAFPRKTSGNRSEPSGRASGKSCSRGSTDRSPCAGSKSRNPGRQADAGDPHRDGPPDPAGTSAGADAHL